MGEIAIACNCSISVQILLFPTSLRVVLVDHVPLSSGGFNGGLQSRYFGNKWTSSFPRYVYLHLI